MFILYAVVLGLIAGLLLGGRPAGLGTLSFRWAWVFLAGLAIQVVLFSDAVTSRIGDLGALIYVLSTALVVAAVVANRRITGLPVVAVGAVCNLAAIVANGGYMPASLSALATLGRVPKIVYSNSAVVQDPALAPLGDVFALPSWLPFSNIFSVGDVLIGLGVAIVIVVAMRARPADPLSPGAA